MFTVGLSTIKGVSSRQRVCFSITQNQLNKLYLMSVFTFLPKNLGWNNLRFTLLFFAATLFTGSHAFAQSEFWSEDFGTGCNQGQVADGFASTNGVWTVTNSGFNGSDANTFFVSSTERVGANSCGAGCGGDNRQTLHISNVDIYFEIFDISFLLVPADGGAVYYADTETNRRAESPIIDCSGFSDISVELDYIEFGQGSLDNATFWYYDGSTWSMIEDLPKTPCCGGSCNGFNQGQFTKRFISLPESANNNPNVQIAFNWTNNADSQGSDPSFAVDNISLLGSLFNPEIVDAPENDSCNDAAELNVPFFPASHSVLGSLYGATDESQDACLGSSAGGDVFYTFTTTEENHVGISVNPFGGADVVVSVLDACDGNYVGCIDDGGDGATENLLLSNLEPGTYIVKIHNRGGDPEPESSANFLVSIHQFPFAGVQNNADNFLYACNQGGFTLDDFVGAIPQTTSWVLDYQWLIGEVGGGMINEWQRGESNYSTRISWLGMEYGSTYNVFVRVLVSHPNFGPVWSVYRGNYQNPNLPGAASCTIATASQVATTELRPNYSPTNVNGQDYSLCDIAMAYNVQGSQNFRWRFDVDMDPNNNNEIYYTRGAGNPSVKLNWVNGLVPGVIYNVAVEVQVNGQWSGFSTVKPLSMALPPHDLAMRAQFCGQTYAYPASGNMLAESVCIANFYSFQLEHTVSGAIHTRNSANYVLPLQHVTPALTPGDYLVRVRVTQNGVPGDFGPACVITIGGDGMDQQNIAAQRSVESTGNATLYPNPNAGSEVRVQLEGLAEGHHEVNIVIYDIHGKQISSDFFGHEGNSLNRLVRFDRELAFGMYLVQFIVDDVPFATEYLIVR